VDPEEPAFERIVMLEQDDAVHTLASFVPFCIMMKQHLLSCPSILDDLFERDLCLGLSVANDLFEIRRELEVRKMLGDRACRELSS
jgi:hypothetical protein